MVLIPNDVGVRMRTQTEASLQPIAPVSEIPADLPELRPGQAFSARIQEVLPENTYKALVAGRSLTLALPEGAKTGDTLELVVVDRTPRLIVAQLANRGDQAGAATAANSQFASLSPAAQLIGALLARDGPPPPAALAQGRPLLAEASTDIAKMATDLAPQLAKAVSQSGLFYEAHQVQWVMGQRPLSDLRAEPQAKHSPAENTSKPAQEPDGLAARSISTGRTTQATGPMVLLQNLFGTEETRLQTNAQTTTASNPAQAVPEDLRPLVQQQLDAAATQRLAWHGEIWPGQSLNWQIEPDNQRADDAQSDGERNWNTSLRLVTPRLGAIDARLNLSPQGVRISIAAPTDTSAADLRNASPSLEKAMAAAGVPLLAMHVTYDSQE